MNKRSYSWPVDHWDWYRHLAFQHGIRCGQMIFLGGQVDKTSGGEPLNVGDLRAQTAVVVRHIKRVLEDFDAELSDVTKLVAYYATDGDVDENEFVADVGRHFIDLGGAENGAGPVIVPTPLPWLALPGMRVEIEAIAMRDTDGSKLARQTVSPPSCTSLPQPFSHGVRCGKQIFVGAQSGESSARAFSSIESVLFALGAECSDLVRTVSWTKPTHGNQLTTQLDKLKATTVVLPTTCLPSEVAVRVDGWAIHGADKTTFGTDAWQPLGRQTHTNVVACDDLVFISAQLPVDPKGTALHEGDLGAQTSLCIERTRDALSTCDLSLDHMVKQTSYYLGNADPSDIVTNQRLRSSSYKEPAGTSTGVPLSDFGTPDVMVSIDTIAMR